MRAERSPQMRRRLRWIPLGWCRRPILTTASVRGDPHGATDGRRGTGVPCGHPSASLPPAAIPSHSRASPSVMSLKATPFHARATAACCRATPVSIIAYPMYGRHKHQRPARRSL
eukprot:TRINITY_DN5865_c0_g1_i1.p4 TRINITY_DN5865_c0_g1~~TRINITY_DN5865_c0_g1_i1.p4  ORF type:complete len:115 (+),score=6.55 TRINITY_DN5865_c0_g1_i1:796-1140(+)